MSSPGGEARPFGFKRPGAKQLVFLAMLGPFLFASLGFSFAILQGWETARTVRAHRTPALFQSVDHGPIHHAGVIARRSPVKSPLGATGAGWVGAIGYIKSYKGRTRFETLCVRGDLSELELKDPSSVENPFGSFLAFAPAQVTFAKPYLPLTFAPGAAMSSDRPIVAIGELFAGALEVPASMSAWCGAVQSPHGEALSYREDVLAQGAHVEVLGCAHGSAIERCNDGVDLFTTGSVEERKKRARSEQAVILVFGGAWNLLVVMVFVLVLRGRLVRSKLSLNEAAARV